MSPDDLVLVRRGDLQMLVDQASDNSGWPGRDWESDPEAVRILGALVGPAYGVWVTLDKGALDVGIIPTEATFEDFYEAYPRKKGKLAAQRAWARAVKIELPHIIVAAAHDLRDHWEGQPKDRRQFIPYPATWLNAGGWDDELEPHPTASKTAANRESLVAAARDQQAGRTMSLADKMKMANQQQPEIEGGS